MTGEAKTGYERLIEPTAEEIEDRESLEVLIEIDEDTIVPAALTNDQRYRLLYESFSHLQRDFYDRTSEPLMKIAELFFDEFDVVRFDGVQGKLSERMSMAMDLFESAGWVESEVLRKHKRYTITHRGKCVYLLASNEQHHVITCEDELRLPALHSKGVVRNASDFKRDVASLVSSGSITAEEGARVAGVCVGTVQQWANLFSGGDLLETKHGVTTKQRRRSLKALIASKSKGQPAGADGDPT